DAGRGLPVRPALAAARPVERHRPVRLRLPATGAGVRRLATDALPTAATGGVGGGNGPRGSVCGMPDVLEPADARGGNREVVDGGRWTVDGEKAKAVAVPVPAPVVLPPPTVHRPPSTLLFDKVSRWYGPVVGVNQVTLELRPGIIGLVGPNGGGKSTLMRLGTGQLRPHLGTVTVRGHDARSAAAKRHVGYAPETDAFYED